MRNGLACCASSRLATSSRTAAISALPACRCGLRIVPAASAGIVSGRVCDGCATMHATKAAPQMIGIEAEHVADGDERERVIGGGRREPGLVVRGTVATGTDLPHGVGEHREGETLLRRRDVDARARRLEEDPAVASERVGHRGRVGHTGVESICRARCVAAVARGSRRTAPRRRERSLRFPRIRAKPVRVDWRAPFGQLPSW